MAVRTATKENRQAAAEGQKKRAQPFRLRTLGIMASRIRKQRQTCLKASGMTHPHDSSSCDDALRARRTPGAPPRFARRIRRGPPCVRDGSLRLKLTIAVAVYLFITLNAVWIYQTYRFATGVQGWRVSRFDMGDGG
ncbi:hypothetical protein [Burkholderia lata]|uniref:hypothetical protein n=1 Tax=Burkholderia lata (strain ATCC 17760 / DSM 23089 / LMG 22485 / NCIMB 9086 / R18194 / 383) TaxID=482957 RepID=UPI001581F589|nr:hypothetical protein [Burkholderia lata]